MPGPAGEFEYEALQEAQAVARYLSALADGLKEGTLALSVDGKRLTLEPRGLLRLRIEAKRSKSRCRVNLKLSWREGEEGPGSEGPLLIETKA